MEKVTLKRKSLDEILKSSDKAVCNDPPLKRNRLPLVESNEVYLPHTSASEAPGSAEVKVGPCGSPSKRVKEAPPGPINTSEKSRAGEELPIIKQGRTLRTRKGEAKATGSAEAKAPKPKRERAAPKPEVKPEAIPEPEVAAEPIPPLEVLLHDLQHQAINDSTWVGDFISKEEVATRWPARKVLPRDEETLEQWWPQSQIRKKDPLFKPLEGENPQPVAIAHFEEVAIQEEDGVLTVKLGDFVELDPGEEKDYKIVAQVLELFEALDGRRLFGLHWYYCPKETRLACTKELVEKENSDKLEEKTCPEYVPVDLGKRIFKASDRDNRKGYNTFDSINAIDRVVKVLHVEPGEIPKDLDKYDYWWDLVHERDFFTFVNPEDYIPRSKLRSAKEEGPRVIEVLDLFSGCGGMSEGDICTETTVIKARWAVDVVLDMCESFKANHPDAHVFHTGAEEFLWLCIRYLRLYEHYNPGFVESIQALGSIMPFLDQDSAPSDDDEALTAVDEVPVDESDEELDDTKWVYTLPTMIGDEEAEVDEILDIKLKDNCQRGTSGQQKGVLLEPLTEGNNWLEFRVRLKGHAESAVKWVRADLLQNCDDKIREFVNEVRAERRIPLPGDVGMVQGGPPCQGVSGLNRHAETRNVLEDPRNRQVKVFYMLIGFLRPAFVQMENVQDILKKGDGVYAKFAIGELLRLKYQTRTGIIAACKYGVPQGRYRVFTVGALAGEEQLPPFPEPTHKSIYRTAVPVSAKGCLVTFPLKDGEEVIPDYAHPPVVIGDVLSDLPPITNFGVAESQNYLSEPKTPYQMWLRRDPPRHQASREERAAYADKAMQPSHERINETLRGLAADQNYEKMGRMYFNFQNAQKVPKAGHKATPPFAVQTWQAHLAEISKAEGPEAAQRASEAMEARKAALAVRVGKMVEKELRRAAEESGPVRDHRALTCNLCDYLRMAGVPKRQGANFRNMEGVLVTPDGRVCAGHTHAARDPNTQATSCPGGGTREDPPRSKSKHGRVDHHDKDGWRGTELEGCPSRTVWMESGGLLCPRWCVTYKRGRSNGRHGCFGRCHESEVQPTVVGRSEPHNLSLAHPHQDRVLSILENKRCQGFPDYFALVGLAEVDGRQEKGWVRSHSLEIRYQQMGNAVCPAVARAMSRCLALSAHGNAPWGAHVVCVKDEEYDAVIQAARAKGLKFWLEENQGYEPSATALAQAAEVDDEENEDDLVNADE